MLFKFLQLVALGTRAKGTAIQLRGIAVFLVELRYLLVP